MVLRLNDSHFFSSHSFCLRVFLFFLLFNDIKFINAPEQRRSQIRVIFFFSYFIPAVFILADVYFNVELFLYTYSLQVSIAFINSLS